MKFVVGLGNPGRRYRDTRHNLGWWVLDDLAGVLDVGKEYERWDSLVVDSDVVTLVKPLTYMNDSGRAVAQVVRESGVALEQFLVVLDDLALDLGTLRIRPSGSSGGHLGLESVINCLGTDAFARLRLGIGPCPQSGDWRDYVLRPFEPAELPVAERLAERGVQAVRCWLDGGVEEAMNRFNGPVEAP